MLFLCVINGAVNPAEPHWFDIKYIGQLETSSCDEQLTVQNEGQTATMDENSTGNSIQGLLKPD